jgi:VanZ family protein
MKAWLWRWGPSLLIMSLIFIASNTPGPDLPSFGYFDFDLKKGGHMLGYALLAITYIRALANSRRITRGIVVAAILLSGLYAITDEFHQSFTPGRSPSPIDVMIDTIGASLGSLLWFWYRTKRNARGAVSESK